MASTEFVVPILFRHAPNGYEQAGTGFIIAAMGRHALVATAGHVLDGICNRTKKPVAKTLFRDGSDDTSPVIAGDEHEIVILVQSDGKTFHAEVFEAWGSKQHDVALLSVSLPENVNAIINKQFLINPSGPKIGDEIYVYGYFDGKDTSTEIIPEGFESLLKTILGDLPAQFGARISYQKGRVIKDYADGIGLVRSPCFVVDVPFNSGMSGGVVFEVSENQFVACGLVSSDEGNSSDDVMGTGGHAVAAKLAPLFHMNLDMQGKPPLTYENSFVPKTNILTLKDLVSLGVIEITKPLA